MIETRLLSVWDCLVGLTALIAIIVLAFRVMVSAVKPEDVLRHFGLIAGIVTFLIMLPAIIASLWNSMSFGQHLGTVTFVVAIGLLFNAFRQRPHNARRK